MVLRHRVGRFLGCWIEVGGSRRTGAPKVQGEQVRTPTDFLTMTLGVCLSVRPFCLLLMLTLLMML